jgi:hypothetical protein
MVDRWSATICFLVLCSCVFETQPLSVTNLLHLSNHGPCFRVASRVSSARDTSTTHPQPFMFHSFQSFIQPFSSLGYIKWSALLLLPLSALCFQLFLSSPLLSFFHSKHTPRSSRSSIFNLFTRSIRAILQVTLLSPACTPRHRFQRKPIER